MSLIKHTQPRRTSSALLTTLLGLSLATLAPSSPSHAEVRPGGIDVTGFGGFFQGSRHMESGTFLGLAGGYNINRLFGVELKHGWVMTKAQQATELNGMTGVTEAPYEDLTLQQGALSVILNLSPYRFTPFFHGGLAWINTDGDVAGESEWHIGSNVGFGVRYFINDDLAIRAGLELWIGDTNLRQEPYEHFAGTIGLTYQINGERDIDGDGVKNSADLCPTQPEDQDGVEDSDGCPDKDEEKKDEKKDEGKKNEEKKDEEKKDEEKPKSKLDQALGLQPQLAFVKSTSKLRSNKAVKAQLKTLADAMKDSKAKLRITVACGFCEPAKKASHERANAIRDALVELGVPRARLRISSRGDAPLPKGVEVPEGQSEKAWVLISRVKARKAKPATKKAQ